MLKGIDVGFSQGVVNWEAVKPQIDYAILEIGYGSDFTNQDDSQFKRNADECTRLGIPFGVYIFSYATSIEQAKSEAQHVLRQVQGYKLSYPIYLDLEDNGTTGTCNNSFIADMAENFCNIIEGAGYWAGIYASTSWFNNKLTDGRFNKWTKWVAQYNSTCTYGGSYDMWQYCSDGKMNGINSDGLDCNYCYRDFPKEINNVISQESEKHYSISMSANIENVGLVQKNGTDSCMIGTTGESKRLEMFAMSISDIKFDYQCHEESIGDTQLVPEGNALGSIGMSKRLEGITIFVTEIDTNYKLVYRCHLAYKGWTDFVESGTFCGSKGEGRRVEAIEVKIVKK